MDPVSLVILVGFLAAMYFLLIRPQRQRQQQHQRMIEALRLGDDVITIGGLHGRVVALNEDSVDLEVTDDIVLRFQKEAIARAVGGGDGDLSGDGEGSGG